MLAMMGCEGSDGGSELQSPSTDLSGSWRAAASENGSSEEMYFFMQLTQSGNSVSGSAGDDPLTGTISGTVPEYA